MLFGVEGDMCRMRFEKNSHENGNLSCFGLGLSLRNENKFTGILKWRHFPSIDNIIYTGEYNFTDGITDWNWL